MPIPKQFIPTKSEMLAYTLLATLCSFVISGILTTIKVIPEYWVGFVGGLVGGASICYFIADHVIFCMRCEASRQRRLLQEISPTQPCSDGTFCTLSKGEAIRAPLTPWSDRVYLCRGDPPPHCSGVGFDTALTSGLGLDPTNRKSSG